jgi:hypothetical protein
LSALAGFQSCQCRAIARRASDILLASQCLKREIQALRPSRALRLWAKIMGGAEWVGVYLDRDAGEELVLVSIK